MTHFPSGTILRSRTPKYIFGVFLCYTERVWEVSDLRETRKYKRIAAFLLAAVLLFSACGVQPGGQEQLPEPIITQGEVPDLNTSEEQIPISRTVAYIPLDDRPSNYGCMSYRAQALGYGIVMPDEDLFMNRLNGFANRKKRAAIAISSRLICCFPAVW